jgi:hypothetical protein
LFPVFYSRIDLKRERVPVKPDVPTSASLVGHENAAMIGNGSDGIVVLGPISPFSDFDPKDNASASEDILEDHLLELMRHSGETGGGWSRGDSRVGE